VTVHADGKDVRFGPLSEKDLNGCDTEEIQTQMYLRMERKSDSVGARIAEKLPVDRVRHSVVELSDERTRSNCVYALLFHV
jgi:hypothetical protein